MVESDQPSWHVVPSAAAGADSETFDAKFVDREEYVQLAISNKNLVRWDDPENDTRGLFDPATGIRYAIAESLLFRREDTKKECPLKQ